MKDTTYRAITFRQHFLHYFTARLAIIRQYPYIILFLVETLTMS